MNEKRPTVWAIEQGSYSDYHVIGVYSSRENAELVAAAINDSGQTFGDKAQVVEWTLDPAVEDLRAGRRPFIVWMQRDGTVERCEEWHVSGYEVGGEVAIWRRSQAPAYRGKNVQDVINATVFATDEKHAVKIVNEHRAQYIAEGRWDGKRE